MPSSGTAQTIVHDTLELRLNFPSCKTKIINSVIVSSPDGSTILVKVARGGNSKPSEETSCYNAGTMAGNDPPYDEFSTITVTCKNWIKDCPIEYYIGYSPCNDDGGGTVPVQDRDCQYEYVRALGERCVGDGGDGTCASNGEGTIAETLTISAQPTGNGKVCPNEKIRTAKCPMKQCNDAWTGKYDVSGYCPTVRCCCLSGTVVLKQLEELLMFKADFTGVCGDISSPVITQLKLASSTSKEMKVLGTGGFSLVGSQLVVKNEVQQCSQTATLVTKSVSWDEFKEDSKLGLYIGVGVGGFALVVIVAVSTVFIVRKRRAAARSDLTDQLLQEGTVDIAYVET